MALNFCHIAVLLYDTNWIPERGLWAALGKVHTGILIMMMEFAESGSTSKGSERLFRTKS